MKKTIFGMILMIGILVLVFNVQHVAGLEPPTTEWSHTYGGTSGDEAYCMIQTNDGGYALAGPSNSFGSGEADIWLVKTDGTGNPLWNQTYGGAGYDVASSLVQTVDGGFVLAGYTESFYAGLKSFYLVRTDVSGNMLWNKTYGGDEFHVANSLVQTSDGGYVLAGYTWYSTNVYEVFVVKTDADGNQLWNKTYVVETGYSVAFSVVQTSDGGYTLGGHTGSSPGPEGNLDGFLIKTDADGNELWSRIYGGTGDDREFRMVQTSDGGYALAGRTNSFGVGDYDSYLIKTDANGAMQWNKTYGGTGYDLTHSLVQTSDGGYALGGYTDSFGAGSQDFWLVRTDADGNMLWNKACGGAKNDRAESVVQTGDGGYALAGGTASFGAGGWDFWLIKLTPRKLTPRARLVDFFLHGGASLDNNSPTAVTTKYKDSPSIKFSGGNPWKEIGIWAAPASLTDGRLEALSGLDVWLGLKNSDDQGTNFDLRAEVYKDGVLLASGETYLIKGVTRNPDKAMKVTVSFGSFSPVDFDGISDTLSLKILTRIGTDGNGNFGGGHSSAVGLRLYFDAVSRPAMLAASIA